MKPRSVAIETMFLQAVLLLIGIGALAFLLWEPHLEGRNAHASTFEIYFKDPLLAYAYVASLTFFVALYQAFKLLRLAGSNRILSPEAVGAVRTIKICALAMIAFVVVGELLLILPTTDETPQAIVMGLALCFGATVTAAAMSLFEHVLQKALIATPLASPTS